jgi:hypothetical protein
MANRGRFQAAGKWVALLALAFSAAATAGQTCADRLAGAIPARAASAPTGSQFIRQVANLGDDAREAAILRQLRSGNVPSFLRHPQPVTLGSGAARVTVCVLPDYLAVGTDADYFLVPMQLASALNVGRDFGFVLPTDRMVDAIYEQSAVHLSPQPLPASDQMRSTDYYQRHNQMVRAQRAQLSAPLGALTAGDKKDLVLTSRLWAHLDRVAIYGWHRTGGKPIQPLSTVHGWHYADYSHGVRLVATTAYVDGKAQPLLSLLQDPRYAGALSREGAIPRLDELIAKASGSALPVVVASAGL